MTQKFTPGPWSFRTNPNYSLDFFGGGTALICNVRIANQDANARLIAAAPELLEACIEALENDESCEGFNAANMDQALREKLRAAIAKAAGK